MESYGYFIMPSHVHLIFRSALGDPSGLMRDLKGFTSRKIMKTIQDNPQDPSLKERTGEAKQTRMVAMNV
jgi:putative transposase